jgi:hypothetical protein
MLICKLRLSRREVSLKTATMLENRLVERVDYVIVFGWHELPADLSVGASSGGPTHRAMKRGRSESRRVPVR